MNGPAPKPVVDSEVKVRRVAYRQHNLVERLTNRLKQNRAIATRYDKLAVSYHAMLTFACILIWL